MLKSKMSNIFRNEEEILRPPIILPSQFERVVYFYSGKSTFKISVRDNKYFIYRKVNDDVFESIEGYLTFKENGPKIIWNEDRIAVGSTFGNIGFSKLEEDEDESNCYRQSLKGTTSSSYRQLFKIKTFPIGIKDFIINELESYYGTFKTKHLRTADERRLPNIEMILNTFYFPINVRFNSSSDNNKEKYLELLKFKYTARELCSAFDIKSDEVVKLIDYRIRNNIEISVYDFEVYKYVRGLFTHELAMKFLNFVNTSKPHSETLVLGYSFVDILKSLPIPLLKKILNSSCIERNKNSSRIERNEFRLDKHQKDMARRMGLTDEQYLENVTRAPFPTYLKDLVTIMVELSKSFTPEEILKHIKKTNKIKKMHDKLMVVHRLDKEKKESEKNNILFSYKPEYLALDNGSDDTFSYKLPKTPAQIIEWAILLANCAASYIKGVQQADFCLLGIFKNGEIYGLAEIKEDNNYGEPRDRYRDRYIVWGTDYRHAYGENNLAETITSETWTAATIAVANGGTGVNFDKKLSNQDKSSLSLYCSQFSLAMNKSPSDAERQILKLYIEHINEKITESNAIMASNTIDHQQVKA